MNGAHNLAQERRRVRVVLERAPRYAPWLPWLALGLAAWSVGLGAGFGLDEMAPTAAPFCMLEATADLPCPACRGTRATLALARGDLASAAWFNPLVAASWLFALAWGALRFGFGRSIRAPMVTPRTALLALLPLLLLNWLYVVWMGG